MEMYPDVQFYDYTKHFNHENILGRDAKNYHLTYS